MKNSIKLTGLFLLLSTGLFAATNSKTDENIVNSKPTAVVFSTLPADRGIDIKVAKDAPGKAIVMIYDQDGNVLRKDVLSNEKNAEKSYILNKLDYGDYTIEVTSNGQVVKKDIHVYDEYQHKTFVVVS